SPHGGSPGAVISILAENMKAATHRVDIVSPDFVGFGRYWGAPSVRTAACRRSRRAHSSFPRLQGIHVDLLATWGGVPAVPEQPDGGLVPPVKVLRKRLNGVYRADGFSGPTRRYVLMVALLVGLASLPTLAAITAGTNELDRDTTGAMDAPFL